MENQNEVKIPEVELFSKERYEYFKSCGLTAEEIATLERAEAACQVTDLVPEDIDKVFERVEALSDNPAKAFDKLHNMRDTDPDAYMEIMAVASAVDMAFDGVPNDGKKA